MFWIIVIVTVVIGYIIYSLTKSYGSEYQDNSFDAFIDSSKSTKVIKPKIINSYRRVYETEGRQILILYGTEYGFSEEIARTLLEKIEESHCRRSLELQILEDEDCPWQPRIINAKYFEYVDFKDESIIITIISTAGDGIPPTDARSFINSLREHTSNFEGKYYSVLALGDSNYTHYCCTGKFVDQRLSELGATCFVPRQDIDQEDWHSINIWIQQIITAVSDTPCEIRLDYLSSVDYESQDSGFNRNRPFMSQIKVKRDLTTILEPDDKETIHVEFDLTNSGLTWTSGDALGIYPWNNPPEVTKLIETLGCPGATEIDVPRWAYSPVPEGLISLEKLLTCYYDLKTIKPELVQVLMDAEPENALLSELMHHGTILKKNTKLAKYIYGRVVADILFEFSSAALKCGWHMILDHMKQLQPRYYSISSSPLLDSTTASVTVAIIRYITHNIQRTGVCSTFLQDRAIVGNLYPVFISENPDFRLPADVSIPIIMIGPGTGLAPFRAFIQERGQTGNPGETILYFGCRHKDKDFLYNEELGEFQRAGLTLRAAFSRDKEKKVYVQHLLLEDGAKLWRLLNDNARVYVCGDASKMAHDVHSTLLKIIQNEGGLSEIDAIELLEHLERENRYQKDVWVT